MWRRQPPVYSPLSFGTLAAGARALLRGADPAEFARLEARLAERYGADSVLLTDSGTTALTLAVTSALAERPGTTTALPAYACYDVATAAVGAGARVRPYDIDPASLGPDWESLEAVLSAGSQVVVVAHLYGVPVDVQRVQRLCDARNAILIEDAAQGAEGRYEGRRLGSFGHVSVLSFGRGKGTTGGGGGALLGRGTVGTGVLERARGLIQGSMGVRPFLVLVAQSVLARPATYGLPASLPFLKLGETIYHPPSPRLSMSRISAAALLTTIPMAEAECAVRRRNAERLSLAVASNPLLQLPGMVDRGEPGYLRLPVVVGDGARTVLSGQDARNAGVGPGYPVALPDLAQFRERCVDPGGRFVGARRLASSLYTLPTHSLLTELDLRRIDSLLQLAMTHKVGGRPGL